MFKVTPNPPETENVSPYESLDSTKLHKAAERALDHHLASPLDTSRLADAPPVNIFAVVPGLHTETLLANASETLAASMPWPAIWPLSSKVHVAAWHWRFSR